MLLSDRVEALTGPDREIDGLIFKANYPERDWVSFDEGGVEIWWSRCPYDGCAFDGPSAYTASLDAAMTLYDELPDMIPSCPRKTTAAALRSRGL